MLMCFLSHILKHNFRIYELDVHIESYDCNDTEERQPFSYCRCTCILMS